MFSARGLWLRDSRPLDETESGCFSQKDVQRLPLRSSTGMKFSVTSTSVPAADPIFLENS